MEEVATGLEAPWAIDFANASTMYITERLGRIRIIHQGVLLAQPLAEITVKTFQGGEAGLLGLALDPEFAFNRHIYVYYTYTDQQGQTKNRVSRLTESDGGLGGELVLFDGIEGANIHDGGRLKIGPDGKLYVTTGDASNGQLAQDLSSPNGKILRLNLDGTFPSDNPFQDSPVYSYGHRNPQGLSWDLAGHLVESEHGPSGISPCCNDEINLIEPGRSYGWPTVYGIAGDPSFTDPLLSTGSDTWAPSGMTFYSSQSVPEWTGKFLAATLRGHHLRVLEVRFAPSVEVVTSVAFLSESYGRLRDVVQGPDGFVYIATSNRDGRGSPSPSDDRILRITGVTGPPSGTPTLPLYILYAAVTGTGLAFLLFMIRSYRQRRNSRLASIPKPGILESQQASPL